MTFAVQRPIRARSRNVHLALLLRRLLPLLLLLSALRWVFYAVHRDVFPEPAPLHLVMVALQGLRFDAMTVVVANIPLIILHLLPWTGRGAPGHQRLLFALYLLCNGLVLLLCCIDLPFFGFNGQRLTRDVLGHAGAGLRELPALLVRYAWATFTFAVCIALLVKGWSRLPLPMEPGPGPIWRKGLVNVAAVGGLALLGRGGWQYQGLSPAHAADHVPVALAPVVTNSAFTFAYSLSAPPFRTRSYFSREELDLRMPPAYAIHRDSTDSRWNVVLLIVESFGREYLSTVSGETAFMPFMDSLSRHARVLTDAYANAERSNKSICALLAGIPSFTEDAFMNTPFAGQPVEGLGLRMKEMGYTTSFFHGGLNGEYRFDSFSKACGFDAYHGRDEFGDDRYYDGHWGIHDEEFLQYTADQIGRQPEPFCSAVFTLSSHDPFPVPQRYRGRFPKGTQEIHESLGYTDLAIRRFFEAARTRPWYARTLFVITGDHTFQYNDHPRWYHNPAGRFAVPILFFTADGRFQGHDARTAQHLDVAPSILDLCGYQGSVNSIGQSVFKRDRPDRAVQYLGGVYRLIQGDRLLQYDGERVLGLHAYRSDTLFAHDLSRAEPQVVNGMVPELQAIVQRHGEALLRNGMRHR